ncbi:NACHT domain-containing protein [Streptomyces sp. NPDC048484]|uniref:NACHT domain-containing protein n=1 Tax=Streptomyces sp. NPDC048484 TaxID=3155146 RepID=UPI003422E2E3
MGGIYLLVAVLALLAALDLARRFGLGTSETVVAVLPTLAPGYLAWAAFHADRSEANSVDAEQVLEQLAVAVKSQWDSEAELRRVNDPYPLPVAWRGVEDDLAEWWPLLKGLARAWPGGPPGDPALWPTDAVGLAGEDAEIGSVFSGQVPTRRLVILGEPGAGKSVLLVRLLQDLIERRSQGDPVPVLFSLASWNPYQPLKTWMADQLRRAHPGLASVAPWPVTITDRVNATPSDLALYLLNAGRILPLLDGFDELPSTRHAIALDMINRTLPARQPLVLASRTAPYRAALSRPGAAVRLNGAAAIQLLPLTAQAAADYLRRDAGGSHTPAAGRWTSVITRLGTADPVGEALATPLGLFLARTIYNPRPGTPSGSPPSPHPDELCDTAAYPDPAAINARLFQAFIPAAYAPYQPNPPRWTAEQAHRTFVFLAQFLQNQHEGRPDIEWWEMPRAIPLHIRRLVFGLAFGSVVGLVGGLAVGIAGCLVAGPADGLMAGLVTGVAAGGGAGIAAGLADPVPPGVRLRYSPTRLMSWLSVGPVAGLIVGFTTAPEAGLAVGIIIGLLVSLVVGLAGAFEADVPDLTAVLGPVALLGLDRRTFLMVGLTVGLAVGPLFGLGFGLGLGFVVLPLLVGWTSFGIVIVLLGWIAGGLAVALTGGLVQTVWGYFVMARAYLVMRRKVPRDLIAFLQDAHEHRGVLRQVGTVYQFRHIDLQRHLTQ